MNQKIGWAAGIIAAAAGLALAMALPAGAVADPTDDDQGSTPFMDTHMGAIGMGAIGMGAIGSPADHMGGGNHAMAGTGYHDSATMDEHMNTIGAEMMAGDEHHDWESIVGHMGSEAEPCPTAIDSTEPPSGP